jgi:sialic acid synthase SpsE
MNSECNGFIVGGERFSPENPLVIAELGTGYGTSFERFRALAHAAIGAGANCVKVQIVIADEILHPASGKVPLPGGDIPLYETFKQLEAPLEFFARAKDYVEERGALFLATPFGPESARILIGLKPALVKIASPELNYTELLETVASWRLPTLLSTGVSTLSDIEYALSFFRAPPPGLPRPGGGEKRSPPLAGGAGGGEQTPVCLLHCVTAYPAPETDYNLRCLASMSEVFGVPVGVSDHSLDPVLVPALSIAMGGCVVEKHYCLSRADAGLDDPIALPPEDFATMARAVRQTASILGSGKRRLAPSEAANYERTNRSIHARFDIKQGEIFTKGNTACLRTEKILRPGLPPERWEDILGKSAARDIPSGEGVRSCDVT